MLVLIFGALIISVASIDILREGFIFSLNKSFFKSTTSSDEQENTEKENKSGIFQDEFFLPVLQSVKEKSLKENSLDFSEKLQRKLYSALIYAVRTCVIGASNKFSDLERTNGWSGFQPFRYNQTGQYLKRSHYDFYFFKMSEKLSNEDIFINKKYDGSRKELLQTDIKKWYYHTDRATYTRDIRVNSREGKQPLYDSQFNLNKEQQEALINSLYVIEKRQGNCEDRCDLILKYLWENNTGIDRIEKVITSTFDHVIVIVNRSNDSDLKDPASWGNAWIIDAWYNEKGNIYHASEFKQKIQETKLYFIDQANLFKTVNSSLPTDKLSPEEEVLKEVKCEIKPSIDRYPTYSLDPFYPIEYYHTIDNAYPKNLLKKDLLNVFKKQHKEKMDNCLQELRERVNCAEERRVVLWRKPDFYMKREPSISLPDVLASNPIVRLTFGTYNVATNVLSSLWKKGFLNAPVDSVISPELSKTF